ncbi:hypothetical protein IT072_13220 [Leifsonia sp. ZF2019]|uniref:DUF7882 family protein n=1 Tax=Leifsonia sp. ZF2019 TaxID=2781978 RepID=UPI001CBC916E|nr:hypothetical protein [Leifsonia sp. ZF2019]UAJ78228.1 hypothetical protein IT072_13220 [Leifsonia sp. ZF2019]
MGTLLYGSAQEYEFDDRTLAHVKIAVVTKLRRHESFLLNWQVPAEQGGGRISLWISHEVPLAFLFAGSRPPALNERWMEALLHSSQRTGGIVVMREEEAEAGRIDE